MKEDTSIQKEIERRVNVLDKRFSTYYNRYAIKNAFLSEEARVKHFKALIKRYHNKQFSSSEDFIHLQNRNALLHEAMICIAESSRKYSEKPEANFFLRELPRLITKHRSNNKKEPEKYSYKSDVFRWRKTQFQDFIAIMVSTFKINRIHWIGFEKEYRGLKEREKLIVPKLNEGHKNSKYLNVKEAADFLKISVRTLYTWASKGKVQSKKIGGRLVFEREWLEEWADNQ